MPNDCLKPKRRYGVIILAILILMNLLSSALIYIYIKNSQNIDILTKISQISPNFYRSMIGLLFLNILLFFLSLSGICFLVNLSRKIVFIWSILNIIFTIIRFVLSIIFLSDGSYVTKMKRDSKLYSNNNNTDISYRNYYSSFLKMYDNEIAAFVIINILTSFLIIFMRKLAIIDSFKKRGEKEIENFA